MKRLEEILARKKRLLERSEAGRRDMARVFHEWQARATVVNQAAALLKSPIVLAGIGVTLWKMPWRRLIRVSGWLARAWKLARVLRRVWM